MSLNDWSASEVAKAVGGSGRSAPRKTSKGYSVCCPAHADRTPSLSLTDGSDGMLLYYCFGGCSQAEVKAALESKLGIDSSSPASTSEKPKKKKVVVPIEDPIEALMPVPANAVRGTADDFWHHALGLPSKVWTYKLANGETAGFIARYETDAGKEVIPWSWTRDNKTGEEKLRQKAMPSPRPLYNLEEIVARPNDPIIWNEGEKAADAAKKLFPGWVSTANPGGGKAIGKADLSPLYGRLVLFLCDHDGPGYQTGAQLADLLLGRCDLRQVHWPLRWPDGTSYQMNKGDDAADHLKAGWTREKLLQVVGSGWKLHHPLREIAAPFDVIHYDKEAERKFARR